MGRLTRLHAVEGADYPKTLIVVVPGLFANSLAEQTCPHFMEWIQHCHAVLKPSLEVWAYLHDIKVKSIQSWELVCEAGRELYHELVTLCEDRVEDLDCNVITIGYRLGAFMLKKAIIEAYPQRSHDGESALLQCLDTMVMIGDPTLKDANREEWSSLVRKFLLLFSNQLPSEICCGQAVYCMKVISDRFEEITMYSRLFHISSSSVKSKPFFRRSETKYEGCVCDASVTVRKWTTADLDEVLSGDEGEQKQCVFHRQSKYHRKLDMIAANQWEP
ncbi:hypothetical protein N7493_004768 [Penicillium malachiteum]|uniref:Uncharacterized protein n=1 Tax=Penicillium malachiteum TaxID=1324776 RepID=A0AAD6HPJ7_9EURO|nr:hypothetical protein N7493_004768 [Penicillium malachiteum]